MELCPTLEVGKTFQRCAVTIEVKLQYNKQISPLMWSNIEGIMAYTSDVL
jgi:predicted ATPase with chaperone activity